MIRLKRKKKEKKLFKIFKKEGKKKFKFLKGISFWFFNFIIEIKRIMMNNSRNINLVRKMGCEIIEEREREYIFGLYFII